MKIKIKQPKKRIRMETKRAEVFQDRRERRQRTRQQQQKNAIKESY